MTPVTIKKAIVTLRTIWNWALQHGLVDGRFPNKGLKYPKMAERPQFQTFAEVQRQAKGLSEDKAADLWECVFLTVTDITAILDHVKTHARQAFVYPMFVFAAHTGARRAEMLRAKVSDVDFASGLITIHARKKSHDKRTTRQVPMSRLLRQVLEDWLGHHPGSKAKRGMSGTS